MSYKGIVKWFNPLKGYGFITLEKKEEDAFFSADLIEGKYALIESGQRVECEFEERLGKLVVTNILKVESK